MIEWALFFGVLDRLGFETQHFEAVLADDWCNSDGAPTKAPTASQLSKLKEDTWSAVCASPNVLS